MSTWTAPVASQPVQATVTVPGSKSQTNRALVLAGLAAALGSGSPTISGALRSRDTDLMIGALRTLGLRVDGDETELTISGRVAPEPPAPAVYNAGSCCRTSSTPRRRCASS